MDGCEAASLATAGQFAAAMTALTGKADWNTMRKQIADSYREFATNLLRDAAFAQATEFTALVNWAAASNAQADYIDRHVPPPDVVIDYGPPKEQLDAAKQAAETACGRKLGP